MFLYAATWCRIVEDINLCSQQQGSMEYSTLLLLLLLLLFTTSWIIMTKERNYNLSLKGVSVLCISWPISETVYRRYSCRLYVFNVNCNSLLFWVSATSSFISYLIFYANGLDEVLCLADKIKLSVDPSGRALLDVSLRLLDCWDRGLESRWGHGY